MTRCYCVPTKLFNKDIGFQIKYFSQIQNIHSHNPVAIKSISNKHYNRFKGLKPAYPTANPTKFFETLLLGFEPNLYICLSIFRIDRIGCKEIYA